MEEQILETTWCLEAEIPAERARLVHWCARLTGDMESAEDLAQETLLEAWKHTQTLRDEERRIQWLFGIARNVYLRWARKRGRDLAHMAEAHPDQETTLEESIADDIDIEVELERKELIELLDRSLALLPAETRIALVKHYVEESPLAEIAAELGSNANAVAVRLQRGKLAMRRLLTRSQESMPYLGGRAGADEWEETRIWCPLCGQRRLLGIFRSDGSLLKFKCPLCHPEPEIQLSDTHYPELFFGIKGYKPAMSRLMNWGNDFYLPGLKAGTASCIKCGQAVAVRICYPYHTKYELTRFVKQGERIIDASCSSCDGINWSALSFVARALPEGREFWHKYPRTRTLPERYIESHGRSAVVTTLESVMENAQFDVVSDYETYEVLEIGGRGL